ncbi:FtsH protease activity modulator HflK [Alkalisalibacterium limincola]|uniref:Protein HflK n=1 Tax=Alkalisalibacterium limincola TaxID=2699169 RepID=A0A5C8KVX1_9GAMM|nr:FtsH protease activity modulator HflK [Alkalisalibacterium limincola]TXK65949.1 FtsH protease activity modulator HflK [Alkalisalibacterium limincola]
MAWNEPGKGGGNSNGGGGKDPWKRKDGGGDDVEIFLSKLKANLGKVFGGGGDGGSPRGGSGSAGFGAIIGWVVLAVAVWLVFDSWQMVDERQRGVVLRFGEFTRFMDPGPNFKWPRPIESVTKVNVTDVRRISEQVRLLTRDENIVNITYEVQYLVSDPREFLFGTREPDETIKQAAESAIRDVIGGNEMDTVLTGERALLAGEASQRLQTTIDSYPTGLQVTTLNLTDARPPQEVRQAFDDAISAREDKERLESEAEAYASKIVPEARGDAARIRNEAEGYREAAIARATGDADRFTLLVEQYREAPGVTRQRLYLETMQEVLANNRKVYAGDGGNVLYLPMGGEGAMQPNAPLNRLPAATSTGGTSAIPPAPGSTDPRQQGRSPRSTREDPRR